MRRIGEFVGWRGEFVTVPATRIPALYRFDQDLDTDPARIRAEMGFAGPVHLTEALTRTIDWERVHPPEQPSGLGLLDYDAEDAILAETGRA